MGEAIQLAVAICPLVIVDTAYTNTVLFTFRAEAGAREFTEAMSVRFSDFRIARLGREVLVSRTA